MSCEFCKGRYERLTGTEFTKKGMIGSMDFHSGKLQINEKKPNGFAWGVIYEIGIRHCPMCGEPLTEPEPLTLEQLREMDGEPVWTVTNGVEGSGRWELLTFTTLCASPWHEVITLINLGDGQADYPLDTYGKTWLAYPRKPREG